MSELVKTAGKVALLKNPITWGVMAVLFFLSGLLFIVAMFLMSISNENQEISTYEPGEFATISPAVARYEPLVRKYAALNGIEEYTAVILALIQQESGGIHLDVMQSSESLGLPPGSITDPEYSIEVGVKYFAGVLKQSKGDIKLALQSYNFGSGYIGFALKRGGYSKESAIEFSNMMAGKYGWSRYGDINYVDNVMRYVSDGKSEPVNAQGFVFPVSWGKITSPFGSRVDPITGGIDSHNGVDFGCNAGDPIFATKSGKVTRAGWENPSNHGQGYGQRIYLQHDGQLLSIYAHLSAIHVKPNQTIKAGQRIGSCGTTGSSTGNHLHFEIVINGNKVNPLPYIEGAGK